MTPPFLLGVEADVSVAETNEANAEWVRHRLDDVARQRTGTINLRTRAFP
jgi:hypothetical protein